MQELGCVQNELGCPGARSYSRLKTTGHLLRASSTAFVRCARSSHPPAPPIPSGTNGPDGARPLLNQARTPQTLGCLVT